MNVVQFHYTEKEIYCQVLKLSIGVILQKSPLEYHPKMNYPQLSMLQILYICQEPGEKAASVKCKNRKNIAQCKGSIEEADTTPTILVN